MKLGTETKKTVTTDDIVRSALGKTYDQFRTYQFAFSNEADFIADIVTVMETPTITYEGGMSDAAANVRNMLWARYLEGGKSATATCDIFVALGRENELGWLREWMS